MLYRIFINDITLAMLYRIFINEFYCSVMISISNLLSNSWYCKQMLLSVNPNLRHKLGIVFVNKSNLAFMQV